MSRLPAHVADECWQDPRLEKLLSKLTAAELRGVVGILLRRSYSLQIEHIQDAVRTARQCECWRRASVAWERYEAARASGLEAQERGDWSGVDEWIRAQDRAFRDWQRWTDEANRLFERVTVRAVK